MIFPVLNNFRIDFFNCDENYDGFFDAKLSEKYTKYLYRINAPLKNLRDYYLNQIQSVSVPGIALQTISVSSLANMTNLNSNPKAPTSINVEFPGTANKNDIVDSKTFSITSKNTLMNWLYTFEYCHQYWNRERTVGHFGVVVTLKNEAFIDVLRFTFRNCFISSLPGFTFAFNENFSTVKEFETQITFNKMDVEFIMPDFNVSELKTTL